MLDYSIIVPEGILVLKPNAPLTKQDFSGLTAAVDLYLSDHAKLRGVLIHAKVFPGWNSFGGFTAHMHFVGEHQRNVRRVAIVTDGMVADLAASIGKHFTSAEIRHFPFSEEAAALDWLKAG